MPRPAQLRPVLVRPVAALILLIALTAAALALPPVQVADAQAVFPTTPLLNEVSILAAADWFAVLDGTVAAEVVLLTPAPGEEAEAFTDNKGTFLLVDDVTGITEGTDYDADIDPGADQNGDGTLDGLDADTILDAMG